MAGYASYGDYPVTPGAYQTLCGGGFTIPLGATSAVRANGCIGYGQEDLGGVLTKLNPAGNALVYSTYLSGNNSNIITSVAVDSLDQAYVTGYSNSNCGPGPYYPNPDHPNVISCQPWGNFPITSGSAQDSSDQSVTGSHTFSFLTKFNAAGSALLYSSILSSQPGAKSNPEANTVAVDASQNAYIAGTTFQLLYTTTGAYQTSSSSPNGARAFAAKFDTVGKKILYSTYITGTDSTSNVGEQATGIAADPSGNAYIGGFTSECTFPTTVGVFEPQAFYPPGATNSCNAGVHHKLNPPAAPWSGPRFLATHLAA